MVKRQRLDLSLDPGTIIMIDQMVANARAINSPYANRSRIIEQMIRDIDPEQILIQRKREIHIKLHEINKRLEVIEEIKKGNGNSKKIRH